RVRGRRGVRPRQRLRPHLGLLVDGQPDAGARGSAEEGRVAAAGRRRSAAHAGEQDPPSVRVLSATVVETPRGALVARAARPTQRFRAVRQIGRGNFLRMYDVLYRRPVPLVPRGRCREVPGRLTATGEVLVALDEEAVRAAARQLAADGVESVAIVFLFSYRDPSHEQRAAELVAR